MPEPSVLLALAVGLLLGIGLTTVAVAWRLGEAARLLDDNQLVALLRTRPASVFAAGRQRAVRRSSSPARVVFVNPPEWLA
jgi:hypothetical protein